MSSSHYSPQDGHFFGNCSLSEWDLIWWMTAMWVALIACSRIISNWQYIPCSLYQTCLVCDSGCRRAQEGVVELVDLLCAQLCSVSNSTAWPYALWFPTTIPRPIALLSGWLRYNRVGCTIRGAQSCCFSLSLSLSLSLWVMWTFQKCT